LKQLSWQFDGSKDIWRALHLIEHHERQHRHLVSEALEDNTSVFYSIAVGDFALEDDKGSSHPSEI
jgi:hypothetical protein